MLIYVIINFIFAYHHEPWFDEARAWEIARVISPSNFSSVLSNEGHPCLWYLFLIPFVRLGLPYEWIKYISLSVMCTASGLLLFSPRIYRVTDLITVVAVIFTPPFMYHYSAIARSYCLATLLIIIIAIMWKTHKDHPVRICIATALLIQTHIFVTGFCFGLCVVMLAESIIRLKEEKKKSCVILASLLIPLGSALFYFIEFRHIFDHAIIKRGDRGMDGYILPFFLQLYNLLGDTGMILLIICIPMVMFYVIYTVIRKKDRSVLLPLIVFISGCVGIAVISHFYITITRGFFLIGIMALFVILNISATDDKHVRAIDVLPVLSVLILLVSVWINHGKMIADDQKSLFSDARHTSQIINSLPKGSVIYNYCAYPCESLLPYLNDSHEMNTPDGHELIEDITYWYERQNKHLRGQNPTLFIEEQHPEYEEIYVLFPMSTNNSQVPPQYCNINYIAAGHEYELIYTSPDDVFFADGLEKFGVMRITLNR